MNKSTNVIRELLLDTDQLFSIADLIILLEQINICKHHLFYPTNILQLLVT